MKNPSGILHLYLIEVWFESKHQEPMLRRTLLLFVCWIVWSLCLTLPFFFLTTTIGEEKGDWFTDDFCVKEFLEIGMNGFSVLRVYWSMFEWHLLTEAYMVFYFVSAAKIKLVQCKHLCRGSQFLCYPLFPLISYWRVSEIKDLVFGQVMWGSLYRGDRGLYKLNTLDTTEEEESSGLLTTLPLPAVPLSCTGASQFPIWCWANNDLQVNDGQEEDRVFSHTKQTLILFTSLKIASIFISKMQRISL